MSDFDKAFQEVIGFENGYVNDPDDPGGETKYGISKKSYPSENIAALTLDQAKEIYRQDFWNKLFLHEIASTEIATEIFEQAVNFGVYQAVLHAQEALSLMGRVVAVDGTPGPMTRAALREIKDVSLFVKIMNGLQFSRYTEIVKSNPVAKKYFVGWLKRVA